MQLILQLIWKYFSASFGRVLFLYGRVRHFVRQFSAVDERNERRGAAAHMCRTANAFEHCIILLIKTLHRDARVGIRGNLLCQFGHFLTDEMWINEENAETFNLFHRR